MRRSKIALLLFSVINRMLSAEQEASEKALRKIEDIFKKIDSGSDELTICKVCGDSMEKARIFDGDYILVDRNTQPKDNAIALITLADNILVKRLKIDDNRLYLFSENDKYPPYEVHETDDFNILGIVKMVLLPAENL